MFKHLTNILIKMRESIENAIKTSSTIRITINIVSMLVEKFMGFDVGEVLANNISNLLEKAVAERGLKINIYL